MGDTSLLITDAERNRIPKYYLASVSSWFGSMALGSVIGYSAPAITTLKDYHFKGETLTAAELSWFGSLMTLGAVFGSIIAGSCIDYIGRKETLMFTSIPFVFGWLMMSYAGNAQSVVLLLIGRIMTGFCCGLISLSAPVYIAETAAPSKRGFLGSGFQLAVTIGVFLTYLIGKYVSWSWLAVQCCTYPILLLISMYFMPETPIWLIKKGRISEATESAIFLHGTDGAANAQLNQSIPSIQADGLATGNGSEKFQWSEFRESHIYKPLGLSLMLMLFQQFSGVNAIIFYTTTIFESSGSKLISPNDATIVIGAVQVIATLVACLLTDRAGRRMLLTISTIGCGLSLVLMSAYYFIDTAKQNVGNSYEESFRASFGWIPIVAMIIFIISFSLGLGPIAWLIMGEIIPSHVKGVASSMSSSFNWFCGFIITKNFVDLTDLLRNEGVYLSFAIMCFIGCASVLLLLPETKGKSLQDIENHFRK